MSPWEHGYFNNKVQKFQTNKKKDIFFFIQQIKRKEAKIP